MVEVGMEIDTIHVTSDIQPLIGVIGESAFGPELMAFLDRTCGAKHCAVFSMDGETLREIAALSSDGTNRAHQSALQYLGTQAWQRDPTLPVARERATSGRTSFIRLDIAALKDEVLRHEIYAKLSERLLISGPTSFGNAAISILGADYGRSFERDAVSALRSCAPFLLSLISKHVATVRSQLRITHALSFLDLIEDIVAQAAVGFACRERQVCARILYGFTSAGIASDLGIGEETVQTYRKRAYQKLDIATQRELLVWYLSKCGSAPAGPAYAQFTGLLH
jgi:DNA-binding CsgD family transcriptional regulator